MGKDEIDPHFEMMGFDERGQAKDAPGEPDGNEAQEQSQGDNGQSDDTQGEAQGQEQEQNQDDSGNESGDGDEGDQCNDADGNQQDSDQDSDDGSEPSQEDGEDETDGEQNDDQDNDEDGEDEPKSLLDMIKEAAEKLDQEDGSDQDSDSEDNEMDTPKNNSPEEIKLTLEQLLQQYNYQKLQQLQKLADIEQHKQAWTALNELGIKYQSTPDNPLQLIHNARTKHTDTESQRYLDVLEHHALQTFTNIVATLKRTIQNTKTASKQRIDYADIVKGQAKDTVKTELDLLGKLGLSGDYLLRIKTNLVKHSLNNALKITGTGTPTDKQLNYTLTYTYGTTVLITKGIIQKLLHNKQPEPAPKQEQKKQLSQYEQSLIKGIQNGSRF